MITPDITRLGDGSVLHVIYSAMANSDYGAPIRFSEWADRSIDVYGTFGAGGSVRWEGSNKQAPDNATASDWHPLTDPQGNDLNITSAKIEAITEVTIWARPRVTAGDGTTSLLVALCLRRANPMRT